MEGEVPVRVKTLVGLSVANILVLVVKITWNCALLWFTHEFLNLSVYIIEWFFCKMGLIVVLKWKMFLGAFPNLNLAPSVSCNPSLFLAWQRRALGTLKRVGTVKYWYEYFTLNWSDWKFRWFAHSKFEKLTSLGGG